MRKIIISCLCLLISFPIFSYNKEIIPLYGIIISEVDSEETIDSAIGISFNKNLNNDIDFQSEFYYITDDLTMDFFIGELGFIIPFGENPNWTNNLDVSIGYVYNSGNHLYAPELLLGRFFNIISEDNFFCFGPIAGIEFEYFKSPHPFNQFDPPRTDEMDEQTDIHFIFGLKSIFDIKAKYLSIIEHRIYLNNSEIINSFNFNQKIAFSRTWGFSLIFSFDKVEENNSSMITAGFYFKFK